MKELRIYINSQEIDISEQVKPVVSKIVSEYRNPIKKTGTYSYTLNLPLTQKNKRIFDHQNDRQVIGKFRKSYSCIVTLNSVEVLTGEFVLDKITRTSFQGFLSGLNDLRLADILDSEKMLRDLKTYQEIDFQGDKTVWESLDKELNGKNAEVAYPFVFDSFARLSRLNGGVIDGIEYKQNYDSFGISHFIRPLFSKIFKEAGYEIDGEILDDETFNKLILLYSNENQESPAYNYAKLNPLTANGFLNQYQPDQIGEGEDFKVFVAEPEFRDIYSGTTLQYPIQGDLSFSLGDDGVYTCKYTSYYTIDLAASVTVTPRAYRVVDHKKFLLFREISENEHLDTEYAGLYYADLNFDKIADFDTLNSNFSVSGGTSGRRDRVSGNTIGTTFTAKLVEGKQYRAQVYVFIPSTADTSNLHFYTSKSDSYVTKTSQDTVMKITKVEGKQLLNPALFLPDMKQIDFIQAVFKLFSLFYSINQLEKKITFYTRDEYYELNSNNITDLTDKLSLNEFEETAISVSEIAETYYKWSTDESDHLLNHTDYMNEVNGDTDAFENAYELPFAPLGFIRHKVTGTTQDYELLPAAIPSTDSVDMNVLEDYTASSNFSYLPKIALYHSSGYVNLESMYKNNLLITFSRTRGLTGGTYTANSVQYKAIPKLSFFNVKNQPAYEIIYTPITREFSLSGSTGNTIYTNSNLEYISTTGMTQRLDSVSLSLEGEKSLFQKLYKNDIAVMDWSNFAEGSIKMSAVLYSQLTGRNIIKIDNDLYLLNSVTNYDLLSDTARIKIYKMLSNN